MGLGQLAGLPRARALERLERVRVDVDDGSPSGSSPERSASYSIVVLAVGHQVCRDDVPLRAVGLPYS
jgi:hypothetical protein